MLISVQAMTMLKGKVFFISIFGVLMSHAFAITFLNKTTLSQSRKKSKFFILKQEHFVKIFQNNFCWVLKIRLVLSGFNMAANVFWFVLIFYLYFKACINVSFKDSMVNNNRGKTNSTDAVRLQPTSDLPTSFC